MIPDMRKCITFFMVIFLMSLAGSAIAQEDLEIEKQGDGIRIIQKNKFKAEPAQKPEEAPVQEEESAPAPPPSEQKEETPRQEGQAIAPDKDKNMGEPEEGEVPLENDPAYVEELNKLTDAYNSQVRQLQNRADELLRQSRARIESLRKEIFGIEATLRELNRQPQKGKEFEQMNRRLVARQQALAEEQNTWQTVRSDLQRRSDQLDRSYEAQKQQLRQEFLERREAAKRESEQQEQRPEQEPEQPEEQPQQ